MDNDMKKKDLNLRTSCGNAAVLESGWDPWLWGGYEAAPGVEEEIVSTSSMGYRHTAPRAVPVWRDASGEAAGARWLGFLEEHWKAGAGRTGA
jgi:hypothetical protein